MLEHGGRLRAAAQQHGIALEHWLELSTGINPHPFTPPALPLSAWQRLPEDDDGLETIAAAYYGNTHILPLAGSQQAIQSLPALFAAQDVAVLAPLYNEHVAAWPACGHRLHRVATLDEAIAVANIVVLCNPNNPDGRMHDVATLTAAATTLAVRNGWLIVDEAFIDATPERSVAAHAGGALPNLIVLRSLGKFFGLAGARVGFALGAPALLARLRERLGPWALAHPSRLVAHAALADSAWQNSTRPALLAGAATLAAVLQPYGPVSGCSLFQYLPHQDADALYTALAQRGILVRRFAHPAAVRFGLPDSTTSLHRLQQALKDILA